MSKKAVLISIRPEWCELIANGKKTIEVRKTVPKLRPPFKVYIYCTTNALLTKSHYNGKIYVAYKRWYKALLEKNGNITLSGKVIGEFVCDNVLDVFISISNPNMVKKAYPLPGTGLTDLKILNYLGNGVYGYGWHISNLKIYDLPKSLSQFRRVCKRSFAECDQCPYFDYYSVNAPSCKDPARIITRAPQSWCYVEEDVNA